MKTFHSHDLSQLPWIGPLPGDIAEVEAYCRIFRSAERLHNAIMNTLCNPLTGECSVSYNMSSEDKPALEDRIVSVLGCMVCLINKGKEDVLSGRSSTSCAFRATDINARDDVLPPLSIFRGEMKRYCESLHVALENYLTPDDARSLNVWRKLQQLKSVCYDSGFPRGDGDPSHTLFANWNPVYLSTSKDDIETTNSEVSFWRGSQVTEEGLNWLLEKGFKTIVDLRAETVKDNFYEKALDEAILSGKVELVKIPVEVGTAPSMDQVEKFATMVWNSSRKDIYLHSREGVWRTSAMVSRWRQYMMRSKSQHISNHKSNKRGIQSQDAIRTEELEMSKLVEVASIGNEDGFFPDILDMAYDTTRKIINQVDEGDNGNGAHVGSVSHQDSMTVESVDNAEVGSLTDFCKEVNPLTAQLPPCNIFSRKEMSRFLKSKKISPPTFSNYNKRKLGTSQRENPNVLLQRSEIIRTSPELGLTETRSTNGSATAKNLTLNSQSPPVTNGTYLGDKSYSSSGPPSDGHMYPKSTINAPIKPSNKLNKIATSMTGGERSNSEVSLGSGDDDLGTVEGDMCASTTGVVRVQSRKKAEMFLVRTDGFSCSREKVTESSLAFTHPSTQQQMLMWKSMPKTVLLLKKLGQELMEEAKEVASYDLSCQSEK